ncbi:MAG: alpha-L-rhamnosidase N-terminal domain-containing protein, partial [Erysipelotrichaceae bacterium]|nr:alpha-L-rhamnosidase N-terminal domain-containing protein [Erysipelotrichaceae bacterium]
MRPIRLRTEYLNNPIGIDRIKPRLSWNCEGGVKQTAYRIRATVNGKEAWDSQKVMSDSMHCVWDGLPLQSRDVVNWTVTLWDDTNTEGETTASSFEMGFLLKTDWKADWITGDYVPKTKRNLLRAYMGGTVTRYPVDCFRKEFTCEHIKKARLYITACGLYEARMNGQRIGDFVMAPGYTDYNKRVQYQTYDVTEQIVSGTNEITVQLADGWYRGSVGAWGCLCEYGYETKLLAQLELEHNDGNRTVICTDSTWQWSDDGPIRFADNKDGE